MDRCAFSAGERILGVGRQPACGSQVGDQRHRPHLRFPKALPGGTLNLFIDSFPLTFRTVGPDSNGSFRSFIQDNQLRLISFHPNTGNPIPAGERLAIAPDSQTVYFKLDPAPNGLTASRSPPTTTPSATR